LRFLVTGHNGYIGSVRVPRSTTFKGFDAVIHLAAACNGPLGNLNLGATYEINHRASARVAKAEGRGCDPLSILVRSPRPSRT
jgi:nucleoside-diphosphate-sugar epimerase